MRWMALVLPAYVLLMAEQGPRFSPDLQFVMVDVLVADKETGRALDLLGPHDFEIHDNGRSRAVEEFHIETAPTDIVFLLYSAGWMMPVKDRRDLYTGLLEALREMRTDDRAAVLRWHSEDKAHLLMTEDKEKIRQALLGPRLRGGAVGLGERLFDAVRASAALFPTPEDPPRRRAIIAITDDAERRSGTSLEPLIAELLDSDATLNVVIIVTQGFGAIYRGQTIPPFPPIRTDTRIGGPVTGDSIRPAIEATGGELIPGDLAGEQFPDLIRRLRLRYLLGFHAEPTTEREFRKIEIRLTPEAQQRYPGAVITARSGYYSQPR